MYIAVELKDQPTWGRKVKRKAKKSETQPVAVKQDYTDAELDAMQAESEALQAKLDAKEDEGWQKL